MAENDFYGASLGLNTSAARPQHTNVRLPASDPPPSHSSSVEPSKETWQQPHHFEPSPPYQSPQLTGATGASHISPQTTGQSGFVSSQGSAQSAFPSAQGRPLSPVPVQRQISFSPQPNPNLKPQPQPTVQAVYLAQIPSPQPTYQHQNAAKPQPVYEHPQYQQPQYQQQQQTHYPVQQQPYYRNGQQPQQQQYYGNGQPVVVVRQEDKTGLGFCLGCTAAVCCCGCVVM